jgi:tRNA A37 threonylcarbamoyladenosine biosynthesis protein TsaE
VSPNLYLVLSQPPDALSAEEYDRWYDLHVRENIVSPGFVSARRYELEPSRDEPVPYRHLALYEYEGDMSVWRTDLTRRIETGDVVLPEWFSGIRFSSWSARPLTDRIAPVR